MKKFITQLFIIFLISVFIGLIYNSSLEQPLPIIGKYDSHFINRITKGEKPKTDLTHFRTINTEELSLLMADNQLTIIDARQPLEFQLGHIPGALNLPVGEFDTEYSNLSSFLEKNRTMVTYCNEMSCTDSELLAQKLKEHGFSKIVIYKGGYKEWQTNGYPIEKMSDNEVENE